MSKMHTIINVGQTLTNNETSTEMCVNKTIFCSVVIMMMTLIYVTTLTLIVGYYCVVTEKLYFGFSCPKIIQGRRKGRNQNSHAP
jgi:hypothetical protein